MQQTTQQNAKKRNSTIYNDTVPQQGTVTLRIDTYSNFRKHTS